MNGKKCRLGLLALSLILLAGCDIRKPSIPSLTTQNPGTKDEKAEKTKYVMGEFSLTKGTDYLVAPVYIDYSGKGRIMNSSSSEYGDYSSKKGDDSSVNNYVFVNRQDLSSRKLFPDNRSTILSAEHLGEAGTEGTGSNQKTIVKNVKAILYQVVKTDTNSDKKLNREDKKAIAIADVNGGNYKELVTGIDRVINIHTQSKDKRVVLYQTGSDYFAASIDIPSRATKVSKLSSIAE
jgi:hypothetical protein